MSFHPYGHDTSMLQSIYPDLNMPLNNHQTSPAPEVLPATCYILSLPNELLDTILRYTLPQSQKYSYDLGEYPRWWPGCTSVLRTCQRLNLLGTPILYKENTFSLITNWRETFVHFNWYSPHQGQWRGIRPTIATFPGHFLPRCLPKIQSLDIFIEVADGYVTSSKFGVGSRALGHALCTQVNRLCKILDGSPVLKDVNICVAGECLDNLNLKVEDVLGGFKTLRNIKRVSLDIRPCGSQSMELDSLIEEVENGYVDVDIRMQELALAEKVQERGVKQAEVVSTLKVFPSTHYLNTTSAYYIPP